MTYKLNKVTIKLKNNPEGMVKINELFDDILSGNIPLLYTSDKEFIQGLIPISEYSNYESDETGEYDLSILGVRENFIVNLEKDVLEGKFVKYDFSGEDVLTCAQGAWAEVWEDQSNGKINRSFDFDYESTVPNDISPDGKAHCYLYISVKS